ncbi:MAG: tRNA pseudouridine(55) synthase TruB [Clostridia bacterium]|nr:tRNA pseudouridine(55) synthase TruB [Clostridia bacterium]
MTGIANINKPIGKSSAFVVAVIRRITGIKKVGHTGTLDPLATGVLPICIGRESTRLADNIMQGTKQYRAVIEFGKTTETQDSEGAVLSEKKVEINENQAKEIINSFIGEITQIPPMYSAIKINGKKMYELARQGIEVERKSRIVTIYDIEIEDVSLPFATVLVTCSKGTYIRTLCADIGEKAGCGAYMKSLVRTKNGRFSIEDSLTLEEFEEKWKAGEFDEILVSPEEFK